MGLIFCYSVTPICYYYYLFVQIFVVVCHFSKYISVTRIVNVIKINGKLPLTLKTLNFCFVCDPTHHHIIIPSSMDNTDTTMSSLFWPPMPDP